MSGGWSILPRKRDRETGRLIRACAAEFLGSISIILWGCQPWGVEGDASLIIKALSSSLSIIVTAHIFSDISGAHFNPAISLAMFCAQRISLVRCLCYWLMQLSGGLIGAALLFAFNNKTVPAYLLVDKKMDVGIAFAWELLGSFLLVFVFLAGSNDRRDLSSVSFELPLAYGTTIFLLHLVLVPLTGCGVNPMRGLAPNIIANSYTLDQWVYVIAPLIAAVVGGIAYAMIFSLHYKHIPSRYSISTLALQNTHNFESPVRNGSARDLHINRAAK